MVFGTSGLLVMIGFFVPLQLLSLIAFTQQLASEFFYLAHSSILTKTKITTHISWQSPQISVQIVLFIYINYNLQIIQYISFYGYNRACWDRVGSIV